MLLRHPPPLFFCLMMAYIIITFHYLIVFNCRDLLSTWLVVLWWFGFFVVNNIALSITYNSITHYFILGKVGLDGGGDAERNLLAIHLITSFVVIWLCTHTIYHALLHTWKYNIALSITHYHILGKVGLDGGGDAERNLLAIHFDRGALLFALCQTCLNDYNRK